MLFLLVIAMKASIANGAIEAPIANGAMYVANREWDTAVRAGINDANSIRKFEEEEIDHEMEFSCSNDDNSTEASIANGAMDIANREWDTAVGAINNDVNSARLITR